MNSEERDEMAALRTYLRTTVEENKTLQNTILKQQNRLILVQDKLEHYENLIYKIRPELLTEEIKTDTEQNYT